MIGFMEKNKDDDSSYYAEFKNCSARWSATTEDTFLPSSMYDGN